eukprot:GHVP01020309.1.p1 GENE.GHVP01020309.1~~GHVP01020309.1.p1  ORF type:complete len:280 (+),score=41.98 GHVP01020309.1:43-840(+)
MAELSVSIGTAKEINSSSLYRGFCVEGRLLSRNGEEEYVFCTETQKKKRVGSEPRRSVSFSQIFRFKCNEVQTLQLRLMGKYFLGKSLLGTYSYSLDQIMAESTKRFSEFVVFEDENHVEISQIFVGLQIKSSVLRAADFIDGYVKQGSHFKGRRNSTGSTGFKDKDDEMVSSSNFFEFRRGSVGGDEDIRDKYGDGGSPSTEASKGGMTPSTISTDASPTKLDSESASSPAQSRFTRRVSRQVLTRQATQVENSAIVSKYSKKC